MVDVFVKQLDGCTYVPGGSNCNCAAEAMWLYRATAGKIHLTSCAVRQRTGDRSGGTNLNQMEQVSISLGVTGGRRYQPIQWTTLESLIRTGRYGVNLSIHYSVIAPTKHDCFDNGFFGNHAYYVSGMGTVAGTFRVGDPGADGRRSGIPSGYQDIPISLVRTAAGKLNLATSGYRALGLGLAYAYITPPDPLPPVNHEKAVVIKTTQLWNDQTKRWVYNGPNAIKVGTLLEVRGRQFVKDGQATYPVTCGTYACNYPGYYVPVKAVKLGGNV